ncbi:MAG: hypothetical protein AAF184_23270, partial [Pseudomonadota bacterium]
RCANSKEAWRPMDSKADERDEAERALLARYHAQPPAPPPAALDAQIRAAAREAVACASQRDEDQASASAGGYARPSPWIALAAAVAMVALVLPGLLSVPDADLQAPAGALADAEVALVQSAPAPLALGGATVREQEAAPAAMQAPRDTAVAYALKRSSEADAIDEEAPVEVSARRRAWPASVREESQALVSSAAVADEQEAPAMELVTQHRLEGRFRPDAVTPDQLNVTLLESLVLIQGDWAPEGADCDPLLTLDRQRGESALVSVERIAGSSADDFVFLRLESPSRVRLVHCTAQGWVISAR